MVSSKRTTGSKTLQIDGTVDVDPLSSGVGAHRVVLAALDPAAGDHRIVLRMGRVHEVDRVVFALGLLELPIALEKRSLGLGIGLAGHDLRLLVDVAETMQQRGHAAFGVAHAEALLAAA